MVEVATIETLQGLLATGDGVELDEDVALAVGVDGDVNDLAILLVALSPDLLLEILDPGVTPVLLFPNAVLARLYEERMGNILVSIESVLDLDALGSHRPVDDRSTRLADDSLGALGRLGHIATGEVLHQPTAVEGLEIDPSDIGVVKSRGAAETTVVLAVGAVKNTTSTTSICTTATSSTEGRALVGLGLLGEGTEQIGGRLRGELVVAETHADLAAGELETIHLCKSTLSVGWIDEPRLC
jgi:hypothetical protein